MRPSEAATDLRSFRKSAGLTQVEVARRMGTTQSSIARAEANWRTLPTLDFLDRFARAVGKPMTITVGETSSTNTREVKRRVRSALGDYEFNPWDRKPTAVEQMGLISQGLRRERFEGKKASKRRR